MMKIRALQCYGIRTVVVVFLFVMPALCNGDQEAVVIPSQDTVQPYTRIALKAAIDKIGNRIAVFAGSRYAYANGCRLRLDDNNWKSEAVLHDGKILVPAAFAGILTIEDISPEPAPEYLKDRWVYSIKLPAWNMNSENTILIDGTPYVDFAALAAAQGLKVYKNKRGLLIIGREKINFGRDENKLLDCVVSLFDTPEKYAEPELATKYIPILKRQGKWTDHLKVTKEELKLLEGPEPIWPVTDRAEYNLGGFNFDMLGSKVPPPGVFPRLLFSEEDLPAIRQRIADNVIAQKTMIEMEVLLERSWLDPETDDGKVFDKLASGDTADLTWDAWQGGRRIPRFPGRFDGYKPGIYSSHIEYNSQCLVSIALYSLIKADDELGRKAADALVNLYKLQEPNIDKFRAFSDSELGSNHGDANSSTTQWRGMHVSVAHMDLPFALDFAGKWMSDEQKQDMYRIVAKTTYGRRTNGGDGPRRCWRDINHVTWHLTHLLALMTIEGQECFDKEAYQSSAELVADFVEWGLDENGTMYESNGKSGGGLIFQILSMNALARRGENLWGHPHWRNLMKSQVLNTAPNGKTTVSSGTWSGGLIATPATMMYHSFYPKDRYAEFLLSCDFGESNTTASLGVFDVAEFDLEAYRKKISEKPGRTRLPSPNYPALSATVIYDTDWKKTKRSDLNAPLDFVDDNYGVISSYSENSKDSVWMNMSVRSSHYLGAGHHHADAGMLHFASDGINWITESPFQKSYDGRFHNQVLIDGVAQPDGIQGRAEWLRDVSNSQGAFASSDLTNAYTWQWASQFILFDTNQWGPRPDQYIWYLCKDPLAVNAFKGTQRYKMRPWWATSNFSNWFPVIQRKVNPVEYAFRSAGMVRGRHSYGLVVDDIKKDKKVHLYQWSAMPGPGVWAARPPKRLPLNMLLLAHDETDQRVHAGTRRLVPPKGQPMLLICLLGGEGIPAEFETDSSKSSKFALDPYKALAEKDSGAVAAPIRIETCADGPHWASTDQVQFFYDRIVGGCYSKQAHFKTLLIPVRSGDELPEIVYDSQQKTAVIKWFDQRDIIVFDQAEDGRTGFVVKRDGKDVINVK